MVVRFGGNNRGEYVQCTAAFMPECDLASETFAVKNGLFIAGDVGKSNPIRKKGAHSGTRN